MIIRYSNLYRTGICPPEDYTPLLVYANGMKTRKPTFEGLETVTGRSRKISEIIGLIQLNQFS